MKEYKWPFVRVVILNYNTALYTIKLAKSIQQQNYPNFEIFVVDNFSKKDDLRLLIAGLQNGIRLIQSSKNLGYAGGNNLALTFSNEKSIDYHLILNSDVVVHDPLFIQKLVDGFEQAHHTNVFAQSPLVKTLSSKSSLEKQIQVRRLMNPFKMMVISFALGKKLFRNWYRRYIYASDMPFTNKYLKVDTINGAAWIVKDSFLRSVNYLDENVFLYHEELIVGKQIQMAGGCCLLNGFVRVDHEQGISTGSNVKQFNIHMERLKYLSEAYFLKEYMHVAEFPIYLYKIGKKIEIHIKQILNILK